MRSKTLKEHWRSKSGIVNDMGLVPSAKLRQNPHGVNDAIQEEGEENQDYGEYDFADENMTEEEKIEHYKHI